MSIIIAITPSLSKHSFWGCCKGLFLFFTGRLLLPTFKLQCHRAQSSYFTRYILLCELNDNFGKGELNKCNSLWKSYFVTKWLTNEEGVHRYFVLKYCLKGIVHVNTEVVKWHWIIKSFWSVNNWAQRVNWWCLLIKIHNLFQCFWTAVTTTVSYLPQRKSHARLLLYLLECNVEQLLHKFLWTDVSPIIFFRGGSVCLSWLLEPSLSIKRKKLILLFDLILCEEYHEFVGWVTGTATPKRCLLL